MCIEFFCCCCCFFSSFAIVILVLQKHLKTFTEVTKQHGIPTFLFHPLPASFPVQNSSKFQNLENDRCELLCDCQYFVFGVICSAWQKGEKIPISSLIVSMVVDDDNDDSDDKKPKDGIDSFFCLTRLFVGCNFTYDCLDTILKCGGRSSEGRG